jgi:hypothetical protein
MPGDPGCGEQAITMQHNEGPRLAEVAKGKRLPELNGTNARLKEILAAQAKASLPPYAIDIGGC